MNTPSANPNRPGDFSLQTFLGQDIFLSLNSAHPRFHEGHWQVSDPEMCNFSQVQGNRRHCAEAYCCMPHKRFRQTCHVFSVIDAEIAEKRHLWTETK
jgi:hypothetical protein